MNTIKLSNYGVTITNANIGKVNEQVTSHSVDEPLTLDFKGIRGIDSEVAKQLLTLLHSRQGGQVFIKNTEPMVKSVLIFSGRIGIPDAVADAPVRKSAQRHFALFGRLFSLLLLFALSFGFTTNAWADCAITGMTNVRLVTYENNDWNYREFSDEGGNHFTYNAYLPANTSYYCQWNIYGNNWTNSWYKWDGNNDNPYTPRTDDVARMCMSGYNSIQYESNQFTTDNAASGWTHLYIDFWGSYYKSDWTGVGIKFRYYAVDALSGSLDPSSTSVASGSQLNMNPSLSGGSGSYNKQYSASPNIGSFDGDNYKAPMVLSNTSVTITLEVSDANEQLSDLAHKTITKTITVTPPTGDLYIKHGWGDGSQGSWSWQKMNKVSDGNYQFSDNYGGTGCNINATNSDEGSKWFGNESDGYYVTNTPALNDKCWFTLSYSDGKLTVAPKTYTLTLDNKGGSTEPSSLVVTYGKTCPDFTIPTKTGYKFSGYNKQNTTSESSRVINQGKTFKANQSGFTSDSKWIKDEAVTLDAIWTANPIKITFKKNGATGGTDNQTQTMTYDQAGNLRTIQDLGYTRTGYDFAGWAETAEGEVVYEDGQSVTNLSTGTDVTLYAKWTAHTTTITLDRNYTDGGTGTLVATYDSEFPGFTVTEDYTRTGYTFNGYKAGASGTSAEIIKVKDGGGYEFPNNNTYGKNNKWVYDNPTLTAYAYWKANSYTITLHYENGTDNTENKSVTFDATATAVTKPSYDTNVFNGYFTQATGGVQVINADGAFLTNVTGYTSNGNWVKASDVDLYAQWTTRTACTITYGVTDGTQAVSTRGTIKAKIGDGSYTNTGSLNVYTGDVVTIEYSPKSGQYYTSNNGYEANGWYNAVSGGSSLPATYKNIYTFTVTDSASVYVKADPVVYTISTAVNPASTTTYPSGVGTVTPSEGSAGPDVALQLTAAEKTGYDWVDWTLSDDTNGKIVTGTATDKTVSVAAKAAGFTATANFSAITYSITYEGVDPSEHTNPTSYTIESAEITLTNPSNRVGYDFTGWTCEGNPITKIAQGSTGNKTITATWALHNYTVNFVVSPAAGGSITRPILSDGKYTTAHYLVPFDIEAQENTGYHFVNWTSTSDIELGVANAGGSNAPTRKLANDVSLQMSESQDNTNAVLIAVDGNKTITANFEEVMSAVTISSNNTDYGIVNVANASVGVTATQELIATKNSGYKFKEWQLTGGAVLHSGNLTDATITIKGNGNGTAGTAQAIFEEDLSTGVYLKGEGHFGGWPSAGFEFMKPTGQSTGNDAYVTITTTAFEAFWQVPFAVFDHGTTMVSSNYFFFNSTLEATLAQAPQSYENMKFFSTVAGDYVFHYNLSTKKLSIEYPHENCVAVNHTDSWSIHPLDGNEATINLDGSKSYKFCVIYDGAMYANLQNITYSQKELKLYNNYESFNNKIWINTVKGGNYVFNFDHANDDHLTVTYPEETYTTVKVYEDGVTEQEKKVYEVTKPSITAQVPEGMNFNGWVTTGGATVADASATTTTVTNAGTNGTVKATFNTNKRIYLKGGSNFNDAYINFYKEAYWDANLGSGNTGQQCVSKSNHMNKVTNTDIFWYDLNNNTSGWNNYFTFVNKGGDYNNFSMCNVVYRNDMKDALPFYVPRNGYASEHHNTSQYFNEGIWMKYNSTESGYDIRGFDNWEDKTHRFVAATPGGYEFKTTLHLTAGTTYEFKIYNDNGTNYGATNQTMTATSCTNWKMHLNNGNCKITTSEEGDYTFVLNLGSGEVIVSVEYPLSASDYRVVAKQGSEVKWEGDLIKHSSVAKNDTTSFFNNNYTYQLQQYAGEGTWSNVGSEVTITDVDAQVGVINLIVTQDGSGGAILAYEGVYTGNYYIRTDGVDGGWGSYKSNSDNKMENYGSLLVADPDYQYDVYKAKWITAGKNVKFRIANDYSKAISDELKADDIIDNKETLPQDANVRFMWNSETNQLSRAYMSGSTNSADRFLVLTGDEKLYNKGGEAFAAGTAANDDPRKGLLANETILEDKGNWVYQIDIQANPTARGKLTAAYNGQVQYFKGSEGEFGEETTEEIIGGSSSDTKKYGIRLVYDFKTNRMVAGWMPSNTEMPIEQQMAIFADVIIIRHEQDAASQITFSGSGKLSEVKTVYGAIEFRKQEMVGLMSSWTETTYKNCMYYISFPFDVKVSEIFGLGTYGDTWLLQYYDGAERASKGWFAETKTFWKDVDFNDTLKANVGYSFLIDRVAFNDGNSTIWKNTANDARVYVYFPSIKEVSGIQQAESLTVNVPEHECKINRTFTVDSRELSHTFTDSHWNMMGVPVFQDVNGDTYSSIFIAEEDDATPQFGYLYAWDYSDNTLHIQNVSATGWKFKAMHSYMVQYAGTITWTGSTVTPAAIAARQIGEKKDYTIDLQLNYNNARVARTYVELREGADADFMLNEDVYMMTNSAAGNIYSLAGSYDVAANVLPEKTQIVPLGVIANKSGEFTFTMPSNFSGTVTLVDKVANTETDLQLMDYTVTLNKGTYEGRFELKLNIERTIGTDFNGADYQGGKPEQFKFIRGNRLHILLPNGRIFNALGGRSK